MEEEEIAKAIALSLTSHEEEEREREQLKQAIAASLGKTVDQLTARDMLSTNTNKRPREEETEKGPRVIRQFDNSESKYWEGTVKLTFVKGFIGPDYIQFEDIVQKKQLKKALVTAFVCSIDFINQHFPLDVNVCIVTHGRPAIRKQVHSHRVIIQPPLKDERYGIFHSKLMLLFHTNSVRVVIGSANLERYDYEDLENVVFIQDFPQLKAPVKSTAELPRFARDICDLLDQMQVPTSVKEELFKYDFNKAKGQIVASVSGTFEGQDEYKKYGHTRLASVVKDITGSITELSSAPKVEMQTSSLGSLSLFYLNELYKSFCGNLPFNNTNTIVKKNEVPPIDIIYPTRDTIQNSRLGPPGAGTICLNTSTWEKATFPKQVMCDSISQRQGTLMHSKYIIATLPAKKSSKDSVRGWIYCGSHNATVSAWGKYTCARDSKKPKMNISNWELGIILPLYEDTDIPAPYLRPAPRYQRGQDAWTQDMNWS